MNKAFKTISFFILLAVILSSLTSLGQVALTVKSSTFKDNKMIPSKYSCEGAEVSPPLKVTGIPAGAKSLAIIVHDPDAPEPDGVTHWLVWNLGVDGNIPESFKGAVQGLNSDKKTGYKGICPPTGVHHYYFYVYALDTLLNIDANTDKPGLESAMQTHILAQGDLVGLYSKQN